MKNITDKRQFFWNKDQFDPAHTTARFQLSDRPIRRERVMEFNEPWESQHGACYVTFFYDEDISAFRMYYGAIARREKEYLDYDDFNTPELYYCYAESSDGLHWTKPALGIKEYNGSYDNNIVADPSMVTTQDNFTVYKDPNPDCPPDERYKMIGYDTRGPITERKLGIPSNRVIVYWKSSDGLHFEEVGVLPIEGRFDSHNTIHWDKEKKLYHMFFRDCHLVPNPDPTKPNEPFRDVMHATSKDFKEWSEPVHMRFQDGAAELQMYTNGVMQYYRGPHMWIGFPTRYYEYKEWLPNHDYLPAKDQRLAIIAASEPREGQAVTDCTFMCSENASDWYRFDEAYYTPGPENRDNWFYGCCYPALGLFEVTNDFGETELSSLMPIRKWKRDGVHLSQSTELYRYSMRVDGFACMHADSEIVQVLTHVFCFEGNHLEMNFRTSAYGQVKVSLTDEDGNVLDEFANAILFGDSLCRPVIFNGDLSVLSGKPIRMKLEMNDADVYSYMFS